MIKIRESNQYLSDQRIEVTLTNGQSFTVMVDSETGKVSILSDSPHAIGFQLDNEKGLPQNVVAVNYYGYPSE